MRRLRVFLVLGLIVGFTTTAASQSDTAKDTTMKSAPSEAPTTAATSAQMSDTAGRISDTAAKITDTTPKTADTAAASAQDEAQDTTVSEAVQEAKEAEMEGATDQGAAESPDTTMTEETPMTEAADPSAPYADVKFASGEKPRIRMETSMGTVVLELWPDVAPKHCQSFVYLTNKGFYDSLTFHRIVPNYVIQGGDPVGNGTGGPGYNVPAEFNSNLHEDGVLSMARAPDPNSAGSQFFICLGRLTSLDNQYTVFGKVVEGLDVVHKIEKVPVNNERPVTPVVMTKVELVAAAAPSE